MHFDLNSATIFKTLTGSRVYGYYTETSDYDYRGVAVPPREILLSFNKKFEQAEDKVNDVVIYDLNKFLKLAADNNPNVVELLWIPKRYWTVTSPEWEQLVAQRDLFLSKKCKYTFQGYAFSQLKRLRSHRGWLLKGELTKPLRSDFGLQEPLPIPSEMRSAADALVRRFLQATDVEELLSAVETETAKALRQEMWTFLERTLVLNRPDIEQRTWGAAAKLLGYEDNFIDLLQREKKYQTASKEYNSWLNWKKNRNPARQKLEAKCGFDGKHAGSLMRLLLMCREILNTGVIIVERPDAELLRAIRNGEWSFDRLEALYEELVEDIDRLYETTTLPRSPQRDRIEELGIEIIGSWWTR
jgi:predicted nucleotidyltransferase